MLKNTDITRVVNGYIGVQGGYLGEGFSKKVNRFTYPNHKEFYPMYCGLDIDPENYEGTTREKFIKILESAEPRDQNKILQGILKRFPYSALTEEDQNDKKIHYEHIHKLIKILENGPSINEPDLSTSSDIVQQAIDDGKILIKEKGPINAVDRIHTAMHGYLKAICKQENIEIPESNPDINTLFKHVKTSQKFEIKGNRTQDIEKIINSLTNILNTLNPIRNNASMAHPNENLLEEPEAYLVINATQTILNYLNAKFK